MTDWLNSNGLLVTKMVPLLSKLQLIYTTWSPNAYQTPTVPHLVSRMTTQQRLMRSSWTACRLDAAFPMYGSMSTADQLDFCIDTLEDKVKNYFTSLPHFHQYSSSKVFSRFGPCKLCILRVIVLVLGWSPPSALSYPRSARIYISVAFTELPL